MAAIVRARFYPNAAIVLALFIVAAFLRTYYLRFPSGLPPLSILMQLHGLLFTAWVMLFVAQARLIAAHCVELHMKLGILVGAGIALRKRASLHKRLILLGMIAVLGPAIARVVGLLDQRKHVLAIQMVVTAVFVAWCLIADWRKHRIVHPVYAIGGLALVASWPLRMWLTGSDVWAPIGKWLVSLVN